MNIEFWFAVARAALLLVAFVSFAWALRRMRRDFAEQLERLHASHREMRAESHILAERITTLATLLAAIPTRLERPVEAPRPAPRREASGVRSYETAKRLARSGATVEEIVATCGVAGTEARLLRRLHGGENGRGNAA
jgi:hypothetical protein